HPPGHFLVALNGGSRRFTAVVGIDDEVNGNGSSEFEVVGDGKLLWASGILRGRDPAKKLEVDVSGVKMLDLIVTVAGDGYGHDHTDWADAKLEVIGKRPKAFTPPEPSEYEVVQRQFGNFRGRSRDPRYQAQAYHAASLINEKDRDAVDALLRRMGVLLARLRTMEGVRDLAPEQAALAALQAENAKGNPADHEGRQALYGRAKTLQRRIALANPLLNFDRIFFIKKHCYPPSEGEGNHMCDQYFGFMALPGGGLFVLENPFSDRPVARDLLADAVCENGRLQGKKLEPGGFLSPELSYDGKTLLFAWTEGERTKYRWTERSTYHLFQVNADGAHLRQLTDGPVNDFDPCWMPNGRILFISERRGGFGRCHGRPVPTFTLHTMNPDGGDIVCISAHETNEWHPSIDHDGMIIYTRWDYVDRGFNQAHHPWITTPDGRDARAIQGNFAVNQGHRPHMEMDVRAIPGSHKYVATAAGHHGQAYGSIVIVDPKQPDDDAMQPVKRFTPEIRFPESEGGRHVYGTAWPLSEEFHLCVYDAQANARRGIRNRFGIHLVDAFGNKVLLYRDPKISCLSPIPLRPRGVPPVLPHVTLVGRPGQPTPPKDQLPRTSRVGVVNVYEGLLPWPEGTRIASLRIVQVLPKTTPHADNPRVGYGRQKNARKVLGTVPVEADGSAWFELPVDVPVYFQALDQQGLAVQSMRSDTYVHPGETLLCQGCHDSRTATTLSERQPLAMSRVPSQVKPDVDGSNPFSYPRLVQPVLDRNCVPCHIKNKDKRAPDLAAGDPRKNPNRWHVSYHSLKGHAFYFDNAVFTVPRTIPGKFGARASKLYQMLAKGHHDLTLSPEDLHRITLWLDCNSDFFGAYKNTEAQARGEIVQPALE
ncbi:MAG: NPCBM/NEW2 domain-containing protein, partial [Candidatus Brocadiae bacterium]|nr:NPCBM/NEW2 domain-containing protein [Candidatus Brocadiia bacterium]